MLKDFTDWLLTLVTDVFTAVWQFVQDAFIQLLDLVVTGFATLIASIPVPQFLAGGLGAVFGALDPGVLYVISQCGIAAALGVIGAGYTFRLLRKFVTLFQW